MAFTKYPQYGLPILSNRSGCALQMQLKFSYFSQYAVSEKAQTCNLLAPRSLPLLHPARKRLVVRSLLPSERRIRFSDLVSSVPARIDLYFTSSPRRALFGGIALLGGFYVAQTISLSFGALGVNDVVAAALSVLGTEYITRFYHTSKKPSFWLSLLNVFKMGYMYGLFIDAFKLAS